MGKKTPWLPLLATIALSGGASAEASDHTPVPTASGCQEMIDLDMSDSLHAAWFGVRDKLVEILKNSSPGGTWCLNLSAGTDPNVLAKALPPLKDAEAILEMRNALMSLETFAVDPIPQSTYVYYNEKAKPKPDCMVWIAGDSIQVRNGAFQKWTTQTTKSVMEHSTNTVNWVTASWENPTPLHLIVVESENTRCDKMNMDFGTSFVVPDGHATSYCTNVAGLQTVLTTAMSACNAVSR